MPVFEKNARLVGRLGLGPRLVADRADVVFTDAVNRLRVAVTCSARSLTADVASFLKRLSQCIRGVGRR